MTMRPFDDEAPSCPQFTEYDRTHTPLYIRLLDADAAGVSWEKIAEHVFKLDVRGDPTGARRTVETHVARAKWMMDRGYKDLLRSPPKR